MNITTINLESIRSECVALCRSVAPADLRGWPLYVLFASEIPDMDRGDELFGCTLKSLDLIGRGATGDRWQGRGPAMLLFERVIAAEVNYPGRPDYVAESFRRELTAIALHEFAHLLHDGVERFDLPPAAKVERVVEQLRCATAGSMAGAEPTEIEHGASFARLALHVAYRANQHGQQVCYGDVLRRCPFVAWRMFEALGNEPARLADSSFSEIRTRPLPVQFLQLWEADTGARERTE